MKQILFCLILCIGAMSLYDKSTDNMVLLDGAIVDAGQYGSSLAEIAFENVDTSAPSPVKSLATANAEMHSCQAITSAGYPCKRKVPIGTNFCFSHSESTPRCGHVTSKGTPCKMVVATEGLRCRYHQ